MIRFAIIISLNVYRCFGAPELMEPKDSVVPFVEKEVTSSASVDSRYALIGERTPSAYVLKLKSGPTELASFKLPVQSEIHSTLWSENEVWFLVRMKTDNGSRAAAIGNIDYMKDEKRMFLYEVIVGKNRNGTVFDILGVETNRLKVVCRFKNEESKRYRFYEGFLKFSELEIISEEDFWRRYKSVNYNANKAPLSRVPE